MAEDTQAQVQQDAPVTETPETPMPSVEQKTAEPDKVSDGLPEDASERTKAEFDKIQGELRGERQRREALEGAFKAMQTQPAAPEPIYDPNTGLLDEQRLNDVQRRAYEAEQRAAKAEQSIKGFYKQQEEKEAYTAHPWLNPEAKDHDKKRYNLAVGIALSSMVNPKDFGDKQLSLKEAGDFVAGLTSAQVEKAKQEGATEAIEQLTPKEQATLEAVGSPSRRTESSSNLDDLRRRTRRGDDSALFERLKGLKQE